MGRNERRRKEHSGVNSWVTWLAVLGGILLVVFTLGYMGLRSYLHSDSFRIFLSSEASRALKVDGVFGRFLWDGLAAESEFFEAKGESTLSQIRADQIATEISFDGLKRGVWEVKDTRISRLELSLDPSKKVKDSFAQVGIPNLPRRQKTSGWLPDTAELESLLIEDLRVNIALEKGNASSAGMRVLLKSTGKGTQYAAEITGGTVKVAKEKFPLLQVETIKGSFAGDTAYLTDFTCKAWENGLITGAGEWNQSTDQYSFEGSLYGVDFDNISPETWAKRMSGDVSSTFFLNNHNGKMAAHGELKLRNGIVTALPLLDVLAAYADTRRFRTLPLSEARTKWSYSDGRWILSDLVLASESLIRLEGSLTIKGNGLDGRFRLGIVPGILSHIPGAETHVFTPGEKGLLWTPLRISGTTEDTKEDLTERLIAAAGLRLFESLPDQGGKVLKFARPLLGDNPIETLDKGRKIIDEGNKVIKDADEILQGILGR